MPRTLLAGHPRVATRDLEQARAEIAEQFCEHRLSLTSPAGRLDVVHNAASVGRIGVNYLRYGDEVRITPGAFETFYLVQVPLVGSARVRVGDRVVASDRRYASLPSPADPVDMIWSQGCEQLLVYVPRDVVEDHAGAPVVFDPRVDLADPRLRSWLRLVRLACDEADEPRGILGATGSALATTHYEQVLVAGLLGAQPNSSLLSPGPAHAPGSPVVHRVLDLVEDRPAHPWRVAELAAEVGISARTLQEAFQRERGTTPLAEMRRVRLERARADLIAGDPTSDSVTAIAVRWGFFHLGRFAQTYRARYGESPSQTLAD